MKRVTFSFFLLLSFFFFSCKKNTSDSIEIANQLLEEMEQACNEKNMKKVAGFYSDDAKLLAPGGYKVEGRSAVDDYWMKLKPINWELTSAKISRNENDLFQTDFWKKLENKPPHWKEHNIIITKEENVIYQLGHSKLTYINNDGNEHTSDVDFILVWKKIGDENYKVFIDTYASN